MGISTALSLFRVARYTTKALSCINTQQFAAKIITKDQQPLIKRHLFRKTISEIHIKKIKYFV
ncbi:hypothetical protein PULV_a0913 [Pseudoalteromonas ulvae UL12]|nr:hypothetical protein [Pseudoalteromonas ulvae UL12]